MSNNVYVTATVNDDGTMSIPAFAVRGLGYTPGEQVNAAIPVRQCICECEDNELFISRCCPEAECAGYRSDGDDLNIPARLLCDANIAAGTDIAILAAEGALVLMAVEDALEDLPVELCCLLNELGISPMAVIRSGRAFVEMVCEDE